jgi:hypothetical protein
MRKLALILASLALLAGLISGACDKENQTGSMTNQVTASSTPTQAPGNTVVAYFNALAAQDVHGACNQLSPNAQAELERVVPLLAKGSCLATMQGYVGALPQAELEKAMNIKVTSTQVTGTDAVVQFEGGARPVSLTLIDGHWKIATFQ